MAQSGQAASYYNSSNTYQEYAPPQAAPPQGYQSYPEQPNYAQQPQYQPPQQAQHEPKYNIQPPTYGEAFNPPQDSNQDFKDTFKIQKPKWNDLWAGLLVSHATHRRYKITDLHSSLRPS